MSTAVIFDIATMPTVITWDNVYNDGNGHSCTVSTVKIFNMAAMSTVIAWGMVAIATVMISYMPATLTVMRWDMAELVLLSLWNMSEVYWQTADSQANNNSVNS